MDKKIIEIIAAHLNGEILTDSEESILKSWLNESEDNRKEFDYYSEIYANRKEFTLFDSIDADKVWNKKYKRLISPRLKQARTILRYAAVIIPLFLAVIFFSRKSAFNEKYTSVYVPKGDIRELILPDSSVIWINSDTELKYAESFNQSDRVIYLTGEAYFKVKRDEKRPFIVKSDKINIKVLGTQFNVNSYPENDEVSASLYSGSISYSTQYGEGLLQPGYQVKLSEKSKDVMVTKVEVDKIIQWREGIYTFDEIRIEELAYKISRWYGVEVVCQNDKVRNMKFSGAMEKDKGINFFKEILNETQMVRCELKDDVLYINEIN